MLFRTFARKGKDQCSLPDLELERIIETVCLAACFLCHNAYLYTDLPVPRNVLNQAERSRILAIAPSSQVWGAELGVGLVRGCHPEQARLLAWEACEALRRSWAV